MALPPHAGDVGVDVPVILFAIGLSAVTTLGFALVPAIGASRVDLSQNLKVSGRGSFGPLRHRAAQTMVMGQIAVSFLLLAGANLLMGSVLRLGSERLGFDPEGVVALQVTLPEARYPKPEDRNRLQAELMAKLEAMPGIRSAAFGFAAPWDAHENIVDTRLEVEGQPSDGPFVEPSAAGPRLFELMKTPLLRGRFFEDRDTMGTPQVAIVSQKVVRDHFGGHDPIGRHIRVTVIDKPSPWMTVVGVVGDWKHMVNDAIWRDTPTVFFPVAQDPEGRAFWATVSAKGDARALGRDVQKQLAAIDGSVEVKEPELLSDRLSKSLLYPRFRAGLLAGFATCALLIAVVGLYGVLAQLVAQRTAEFGMRRAVGAQTRDLMALVARQGGIPVLAGLCIGISATLALGQTIQSMLYGVRPGSPAVLISTALVFLAAGALGMVLPARRAGRVDPMSALRQE